MTQSIKTQRLILRPFGVPDGDAVVAVLGQFEVTKWLARVPHPFTHDDLRLLNEDGSDRWPELMAVTLNDEVIGGISSVDHLGFWLSPNHWGRGYATEAARAVLDHAFNVRGLTNIVSGHFHGNVASANVLGKLGFKVTGEDMLFLIARAVSNCAMSTWL